MKLPKIEIDETKLIEIAKKYNVKELYFFGSILTDNFSDTSDIDILISFNDNSDIGLFELFDFKDELQSLYQREIDLIEKEGLRNPYRKKSILESARLIYAA